MAKPITFTTPGTETNAPQTNSEEQLNSNSESPIVTIVQTELSSQIQKGGQGNSDPSLSMENANVSILEIDEFAHLKKLITEAKIISSHDEEGVKEKNDPTNANLLLPPKLRRADSYHKKKIVQFEEKTTKKEETSPPKPAFNQESVPPPLFRTFSAPNTGDKTKPRYDYEATKVRSSTIAHFDEGNAFASTPTDILKKDLNYVIQMPTKLYFDEKAAAKEVIHCLKQFPDKKDLIADILVGVRGQLTPKQKSVRLSDMLNWLALDTANAPFLHSYFLKIKNDDIDVFANQLMKKLLKKQGHYEILTFLTAFTKADFFSEKPQTLGRQTTISSSLCREYGIYFWKKEIETLVEATLKRMKTFDVHKLVLERDAVAIVCNKELKFKELERVNQDLLIEERRKENAITFIQFAKPILTLVYSMRIPEQFSELLQMRRFYTMDFLKSHLVTDNNTNSNSDETLNLSRTYIAELLFLRLLNPALVSVDDSDEVKSIMKSLTKLIQCLASQAPFGVEKKDPIYEMLNPLYEEFRKPHVHFFDLNTEPRKIFK